MKKRDWLYLKEMSQFSFCEFNEEILMVLQHKYSNSIDDILNNEYYTKIVKVSNCYVQDDLPENTKVIPRPDIYIHNAPFQICKNNKCNNKVKKWKDGSEKCFSCGEGMCDICIDKGLYGHIGCCEECEAVVHKDIERLSKNAKSI